MAISVCAINCNNPHHHHQQPFRQLVGKPSAKMESDHASYYSSPLSRQGSGDNTSSSSDFHMTRTPYDHQNLPDTEPARQLSSLTPFYPDSTPAFSYPHIDHRIYTQPGRQPQGYPSQTWAYSSAPGAFPVLAPFPPSHGLDSHGLQHGVMPTSSSVIPPSQAYGVYTPGLSPHQGSMSVFSDDHAVQAEETLNTEEQGLTRRGAAQAISTVLSPRPSGVRKKNAKIEIPSSLTVEIIERLLETEKNPGATVELKKQKRLLKNRHAALQSRFRKKEHIDRLERENKALKESLRTVMESQQLPPATSHSLVHSDGEAVPCLSDRLDEELERLQAEEQEPGDAGAIVDFDLHSRLTLGQYGYDSPAPEDKQESRSDGSGLLTSSASADPLTLLMYGAHVASTTGRQQFGSITIPSLPEDQCEAAGNLLQALYSPLGSSSTLPQAFDSVTLDLNNPSASDVQAIAEFKKLCEDESQRRLVVMSRDL